MNEIIVALITGGITLLGVLISNGKAKAVTDTLIQYTLVAGGVEALLHQVTAADSEEAINNE